MLTSDEYSETNFIKEGHAKLLSKIYPAFERLIGKLIELGKTQRLSNAEQRLLKRSNT